MLPLSPFYMIRHGQTVANAARIAAGGQSDTPLNQTGVEQAKSLASIIGQLKIKPRVIHHSNMQRARHTAKHLNESLKLPIHERHDLREHDMGVWEGKPWDHVLPRLKNKEFPEGGETEQQFSDRIQNALSEIITTSKTNGPPMIVAHGGLFHALGFMYEYGMSSVQNCHLHYFDPHPENALFPWKVWQYDIKNGALIRSTAVFCEPQMQQAS